MAVALTELDRWVFIDGNKLQIVYQVDCTDTYPAGGYTVNNAVYPSAAQVFKEIQILIPFGGSINQNDYLIAMLYTDIVNTVTTNPVFKIRVYHADTGGGGWTELATGVNLAQTFYIIVGGVMKGGVSSTNT